MTFTLFLTDQDLQVGEAETADQAVALAAGLAAAGVAVTVCEGETPIAWVGLSSSAQPPQAPLSLSVEVDAEDAQKFLFTVSGTEEVTQLDFGDGNSHTLPAGETEWIHRYETPGSYTVSAYSGGRSAESYIQVSPGPELPLQLLSLEPSACLLSDDDFTLDVNGSGFDPGAVIVFNHGDEQTVYVSSELLQTTVKPSTASGPFTIPVQVRNADGGLTDELDFSFTEG